VDLSLLEREFMRIGFQIGRSDPGNWKEVVQHRKGALAKACGVRIKKIKVPGFLAQGEVNHLITGPQEPLPAHMLETSRKIGLFFLAASIVLLAGCSKGSGLGPLTTTCRALRICEDPGPSPIAVDLVCDGSRGSTCSPRNYQSTMEVALRWASSRPGSVVRLWALGNTLGDTVIVGEQHVPKRTKSGSKARRAAERRFFDTAKEYFLKSAEPFLGSPAKRRSPLLEGLSKVAVAGNQSGYERHIVIVTDGREYSDFGDFECGSLPNPGHFVGQLHEKSVLSPGMLAGNHIYFSFFTMGEVDRRRCRVSMDRELRTQNLWRTACTRAGAFKVQFNSGIPRFEGSPEGSKQEEREQ